MYRPITFAIARPTAWNILPPVIRSSATYNTVKKDLKSHLFWTVTILYFDYGQRSCSNLYRLLAALYRSSDLHYNTNKNSEDETWIIDSKMLFIMMYSSNVF